MINRDDSYFNLHPTTTRGFLETVNWNLKQAEIMMSQLKAKTMIMAQIGILLSITSFALPSAGFGQIPKMPQPREARRRQAGLGGPRRVSGR